jgi:hypothetical protein
MNDPVIIAGVAFVVGLWSSVPIRWVCRWMVRKYYRPGDLPEAIGQAPALGAATEPPQGTRHV